MRMYTNIEFGYRELSSHSGMLAGIVGKGKKRQICIEKSLRNCPFFRHRQTFRVLQTFDFGQLFRADNSSQIFEGRK